ncbi:MAG: NAD(P)/FAD-dependent oxidoreductase [Campylobacterota bacterium]|nr:NAD(P)/FAD-dependent oxidoreductase [Campylobacterota bacterium]
MKNRKIKTNYDLIVVGAGAAGMIAAIQAARDGKKVLLLEKLSKIGTKLKATGGGRCNLTNRLTNEEFIEHFGRDGRFMQDALKEFDHHSLVEFFKNIGVQTHAPDGFRVFPISHNSTSIIAALQNELDRLHVDLLCNQRVIELLHTKQQISGVKTHQSSFFSLDVVVATGGLGYPSLGAQGDGYVFSSEVGHKITDLYPAMMPLKTKQRWVKNCRADTIAKVLLHVDIKKYKKLKAVGDLIFTKDGIRGPVVLDFAREITPLLSKYDEVPILANLTRGMNEQDIDTHVKAEAIKNRDKTIGQIIATLVPERVALELCLLCEVDPDAKLKSLRGDAKAKLINYLAWTPLTITGHDGFEMAMITRGGISLKEIDPKTMQSKILKGLYFCGEILNLDGPCGGYNLQWSFSSGYLAGKLK